ncbi:chlorophyll a/b-binding protein [Thermoleptolyngbya sp. M55_K2018_002]|uniref:chlorophyll a/b-binding protein n=1 Tax=Thermoleptolyngbya sp. M55_K2018_002 TaxID=2747808 RepID=UPI0019FA664E|nr:chlorophyll a/b-binding protein [Thermoleptolyngbya sp. M55_K2018_002]HIK39044.1 high light inducible protein [Thermoleptolyngbya sp. M55_K2018_002]
MRGVVTEEQGRQNIYAVEPQMYVDSEVRTGFTEYAEKLNGRLAMIGFVSMLLLEVFTHQGLVSLLQNL